MTYVVKAMCYIDANGNGTSNLKHAQPFESKEMADLTAHVCGGEVIRVVKPEIKKKTTPEKKKRVKRENQAWMRGGC